MVYDPEVKYSFCKSGSLCKGPRSITAWSGNHKDKLVMEKIFSATSACLPKFPQRTVVRAEPSLARVATGASAPLPVVVNTRFSRRPA